MEEAYEKSASYKAEDGGRGRIELEAAEALAALAHSSSSTRNFAEDDLEGSSERVKNKSSPEYDSDQAEVVKACSAEISAMMINSVITEEEIKLKPRLMCNRGHLSVYGSKSQHILTEAEKEERRLRRVLANRESARQTIRRRQAIYEDLTRKAVDLAMENENLKREKEQALREYDSLKSINKRLKTRVAKVHKAEAKENRGDLDSTCSKASTSTSGTPALPCNQPSVVPFFWPSAIQSSDAFHLPCECQKCSSIASQVHVPPIAKSDSDHEQENSRMSFRPGNPIYVLPFPWFFPFQTQCNVHNPQPSDHNATHNKACLNLLCSTSSSSKSEVHMENHHSSLPAKINSEISCSAEMISNPHETAYGLAPDKGGDTRTGSLLLNPLPVSCARTLACLEPSHKHREHVPGDISAIPSAAGNAPNCVPEKSEGPVIFPNKKSVGAIVATQARRRRKELTKLKNLHCSSYHTH